jgi:hypothetical protein
MANPPDDQQQAGWRAGPGGGFWGGLSYQPQQQQQPQQQPQQPQWQPQAGTTYNIGGGLDQDGNYGANSGMRSVFVPDMGQTPDQNAAINLGMQQAAATGLGLQQPVGDGSSNLMDLLRQVRDSQTRFAPQQRPAGAPQQTFGLLGGLLQGPGGGFWGGRQ